MSHLTGETVNPRDFKRRLVEAAVIPLPKPEITPPETKMNFGNFLEGTNFLLANNLVISK